MAWTPWTDTFTDVPWNNGDYLTSLKLGQMVANDRWASDQLSHQMIGSVASPEEDISFTNPDAGETWRLQIYFGTTWAWTSADITSSSSVNASNIDMTGITDGALFNLRFVSSWNDGGTWEEIDETQIEVVKSQAMVYLSHWTTVGIISDDNDDTMLTWSNSSLITHRESQTW